MTSPTTDTATRTLPATVQDFIAANFENPVSRAAKTQAAMDTYRCLWADERGDMDPEQLDADICMALQADGEAMAIKLALAVRDCINREDAALGNPTDAPAPDAPLVPEITQERGAELTEMQHTAAAIDQAVMDAEEVFRDLGRLEGVSFMATVADVAAAQIFEKIKHNKGYKNIPYIDADGNRRRVADLEEFCQVKLGKSSRRVRELVQNLHILGSDLYESAERIGFRAKDYRALRALPEAEQAIVKQALESESKDEVLDILQDMAAKHQAEREAAQRREEDLTADYEARGKLLEDKGQDLERTKEELFKLKSLPKDADLELKLAREQEAVKALGNAYMTALVGLNELLVQTDAVLTCRDISAHTSQYVVSTIGDYCRAVNAALVQHEIPVDFEEEVSPAWMREAAQADLEAGRTNTPNGRSW